MTNLVGMLTSCCLLIEWLRNRWWWTKMKIKTKFIFDFLGFATWFWGKTPKKASNFCWILRDFYKMFMQLEFLKRRKLATKSWGPLLGRKRCPLNFTLYVTRYCGWSSLFQKEKLSASAKNIHSTPFSFAFCGWTLVLTNRSLRESLAELNRSARASAHFSIPSLSSWTCRAWSGT